MVKGTHLNKNQHSKTMVVENLCVQQMSQVLVGDVKKTKQFCILGCLNRDQNQYIARGVPKVAVKPPSPLPN